MDKDIGWRIFRKSLPSPQQAYKYFLGELEKEYALKQYHRSRL